MVLKPGKLQRNNDDKIYVGRSTTVPKCLFSADTLCVHYVTEPFLLVSSSDRCKHIYLAFCMAKAKNTKTCNKELCRASYIFPSINYGTIEAVNSPSMASGDTMCVAIGEESTYCIPSRGPLVAMPTPRPEEINQSISRSVS